MTHKTGQTVDGGPEWQQAAGQQPWVEAGGRAIHQPAAQLARVRENGQDQLEPANAGENVTYPAAGGRGPIRSDKPICSPRMNQAARARPPMSTNVLYTDHQDAAARQGDGWWRGRIDAGDPRPGQDHENNPSGEDK